MAKLLFSRERPNDTRTTGRRSQAFARSRGDRPTGPWAATEDGDRRLVVLPGSQHAAVAGDCAQPRHHRHGVRPNPAQQLEPTVLRCFIAAEYRTIPHATRGFRRYRRNAPFTQRGPEVAWRNAEAQAARRSGS